MPELGGLQGTLWFWVGVGRGVCSLACSPGSLVARTPGPQRCPRRPHASSSALEAGSRFAEHPVEGGQPSVEDPGQDQ